MVDGLVSVIIPVHNRPRLIEEAVESVLAQTYHNFEIIIVDDGSTDSTPETIIGLESAHPGVVRHVHQSNSGPGVAREAGRQTANGEFIQYLDSDDLLLPNKFEVQVAALRRSPDAGVAFGKSIHRDLSGKDFEPDWKSIRPAERMMFPSLLHERWWDTPVPLYRRSVTDAAGPWSDLWLEEDWEYDCRIASAGTKLIFCDERVAVIRDATVNRLSTASHDRRWRMRQRTKAHELMAESARKSGIPLDAPEMRSFSRRLFLLARQCGAAGLQSESKTLFELSRAVAGTHANDLQYRVYSAGAAIVGWSTAGRISCWTDRFRSHA